MKIPLLDLSVIHQPLHQEIMAAIDGVVRSEQFILGSVVEKLELDLASYCGTSHALGVSSGTDALLLALMALDIRPGDEVITSTYTFFATAGSIARVGARPVFIDIDPLTYNMNIKHIEQAITPKTKAIIPVHLFGQCADMDPILSIAKKHNLFVIEDAAQAIGTTYQWAEKKAGALGDIGCFSFFPSKNLGAMGDAGLVTTNNPDLFEKLHVLRVHGSKPKYHHSLIGGNFRIDALQAAILSVKIKHLDSWTQARINNANHYSQSLLKTGIVKQQFLQLPHKVDPSALGHIYNQYVVRTQKRDELAETLRQNEIGCEVYYPIPLHLQKCFASLGYKAGDFPEAEKASRETLAIPIYPGISTEQLNRVIHVLSNFPMSHLN